MIDRLKIKDKFLAVMLGLSFLSFALIGMLSWWSLRHMDVETARATQELSDAALNDSEKALLALSRKELRELAEDQAAITTSVLEDITEKLTTLEALYLVSLRSGTWNGPNLILQETAKPPVNARDYCVYIGPEEHRARFFPEQAAHALKAVFSCHSELKTLFIAMDSGAVMAYPWSAFPKGFNALHRTWFKSAREAEGRFAWSEPYASATDEKLTLTCSKRFNLPGGEAITIGADIDIGLLTRNFTLSQTRRRGYAVLIDRDTNVIASEDLTNQSHPWQQPFKANNLTRSENPWARQLAERVITEKSGEFEGKFRDIDVFAAFAPVSLTNWTIIIGLPAEEVLAPTRKTEQQLQERLARISADAADMNSSALRFYAGICAVLIVILGLTVAHVSRRITSPIYTLIEGTKRIGEGDLDFQVHLNTRDELELLAQTVNRMAVDLKDHIARHAQAMAARERVENELRIAADIQKAMLPRQFPAFPDRPELDVFAIAVPARHVGGDFYDFFFLDADRLFFCLGDVSGKGMPAALFMVNALISLRDGARRGGPLNALLAEVNNKLEMDNPTCMFATVFCGVLNTASGELTFVNAGHNPPLKRSATGVFAYLDVTRNQLIGAFASSPERFVVQTMELNPGDCLFVYSDGVTEAMDADKTLFGCDRLSETLNRGNVAWSARELTAEVSRALEAFRKDEPRSDDITILTLRILPAAPSAKGG